MDRVGIFIDGANIYYALCGSKINYMEFRDWIAAGRPVSVAYYFDGSTTADDWRMKETFYDHLRHSGFRVHIKKLTFIREMGFKQSGIDVYLAVKAMRCINDFDVMALVSGDYDFMPLVEEMRMSGKRIEVVAPEKNMHPIYKRFTHKYLEEFLKTEKKVEQLSTEGRVEL